MTTLENYEDRVVAFIDILGFRELIRSTLDDQAIARKVHDVLIKISQLKKDNDQGTLSLKKLGKEVSVFSDSIVISYPLSLKSATFHLILAIIHLKLHMMSVGILMRGGISVGKLYHNDNIVYGPAMIKAYDLESKYAIYPRVVVHEDVLQIGAVNGSHEFEEELKYISELLEKDEDNQFFIDYMFQWQEIDDEIYYFQALDKTKALIEEAMVTINKPDVLLKYNWLKRYYNKTLNKLKPEYTEGRYL